MLAPLITASADLQPPPEELEEAAGKQDICAAPLPAAPAAPAVNKLRKTLFLLLFIIVLMGGKIEKKRELLEVASAEDGTEW